MPVTETDTYTIALASARAGGVARGIEAARAYMRTQSLTATRKILGRLDAGHPHPLGKLPTLTELDGDSAFGFLGSPACSAAVVNAFHRGLDRNAPGIDDFLENQFARAYQDAFSAALEAEAIRLGCAALAPAGTWVADDGGISCGEDVGGDVQAGDGYSVRYRRADVPTALITEYVYPVEYDEHPGTWMVQIQTEFLVCDDPAYPGDTETWSTYDYNDDATTYQTAAQAEHAALETAASLLAHGGSEHSWDGQPWHDN